MGFYQPLYISKPETGLVQGRQNFILPDDAYPVLENAIVWRERIIRKSGFSLLGQLRRVLTGQVIGTLSGAGAISGNIKTTLSLETNAVLQPSSLTISDGTNTYTENGLGILTGSPGGTGTIKYATMAFTITGGAPGGTLTASFSYFPLLPVMGLRNKELDGINLEQLIAFDTKYAYVVVGGQFVEWILGTTWTGTDFNFFWSTNYWVSNANHKIFWVTNFSGITGDPIRYTDGSIWENFAPQIDNQIPNPNLLTQCLCIIPFRGRLVVFNTFEGTSLGTSTQFRQRIRWSAIGNPFTTANAIVTAVNANAWRDDIPGQGGFLDIPTAEDIISVGYVRDNVVVYCENSTWQLRYTGRAIAPFQIERVNSELGVSSTFSSIQFDTSLVGIGDKGVVECDSYKSQRIDVKIPDLIFRINSQNNGQTRVHGIRDFQQKIAYWTYPSAENQALYPDRRLVYNYENDSWATFIDSFTTLGIFRPTAGLRWIDFPSPDPNNQWQSLATPWINRPTEFPAIVGGNQQGYVEYLGQFLFDDPSTNDVSLTITGIAGNVTTPTVLTVPNHNLITSNDDEPVINQIVRVIGIPTGTPFASTLNNNVFGIVVLNPNQFQLWQFNPVNGDFDIPQIDPNLIYVGGGQIAVVDNFNVVSKKFNSLENGQAIQMGYLDILTQSTSNGAFSLNVYTDYNDTQPVNTLPQNDSLGFPDVFFNTVIPTNVPTPKGSSKVWQRVYCSARGAFITLQYFLSNAQMVGNEQKNKVQIDAQILYMRSAGKQLITF